MSSLQLHFVSFQFVICKTKWGTITSHTWNTRCFCRVLPRFLRNQTMILLWSELCGVSGALCYGWRNSEASRNLNIERKIGGNCPRIKREHSKNIFLIPPTTSMISEEALGVQSQDSPLPCPMSILTKPWNVFLFMHGFTGCDWFDLNTWFIVFGGYKVQPWEVTETKNVFRRTLRVSSWNQEENKLL